MNTIVVKRDQAYLYGRPEPIPQGQSQFSQIKFEFSDEWDGLRKIVQFDQGGKTTPYNVSMSNDLCFCPSELTFGSVSVRVKGYSEDTDSPVIATANEILLPVSRGFQSGGTPPVPPTPDLYQKLLEEFKKESYAQAIEALDGKLDKNQGADNAGKALVVGDDGNVVPGEAQGGSSLPVASPTQLGGVKPVAKTDTMTRGVGVDTDGGLYTEPGAWYVTVTQAFSDSVMATAYKTAAEVYAAYQAGYAVYARVRLANVRVGFYVLPLVACIPNGNGGVATLGFSVAGQQSSVETPKVIWVLFRNNQWVIVSTDLAGLKDIPTALPNPNALAIKVGDTTTTYDGSAAKTVEVPDGNNPLGITSATVGQIPKITAVDASGVPTAWSPVDMAGGDKWEKLIDTSLAESVESVTYTFDDCKRTKALIAPALASDESYSGWTRISINNVSYPLFNSKVDAIKGMYFAVDSVYPPYVQASLGTNSNTSTYGFISGIQTTALENIAPNGITELGCQTAELLKAGTKIEIWGVKS